MATTTSTDDKGPIFFWRAEEAWGFLGQWYMADFTAEVGLGGEEFEYCCAEQ
jgi:hypothetical protein